MKRFFLNFSAGKYLHFTENVRMLTFILKVTLKFSENVVFNNMKKNNRAVLIRKLKKTLVKLIVSLYESRKRLTNQNKIVFIHSNLDTRYYS